jgi:biopolymer transport protein ExbD
MPSKRNTILILIVAVVGIWASTLEDWRRDVPHYPPDFAAVYGLAVGTGMPAPTPVQPRPKPGPKPPAERPDVAVPDDPDVPEEGNTEVRIKDITLQPVSGQPTRPVADSGDESMAILRVYPDGKLRWGGLDAGSYEMVGKLCSESSSIEDFSLVIVPDHKTPWKYVYWAMEVARENGVYNVGLGVTPTWDEKRTLLAQLLTPLPKEDYVENPDCPTIEVLMEEDKTGNIDYTVFRDAVTGWRALFPIISGYNGEYAEIVDVNYARDPSKTPWVVTALPETSSGAVLRTLEVIRQAAIYTIRFGGEFPARPK